MTLHNPHLEGAPFLWEAGPNASTAVLLIHGLTATPREVRPFAEKLHSQGFTVAGPLLPGHRESIQALNRTRWQDWYAEVERAYLALAHRCERVYVGGESCGGLLALLLGARHPAIAAVFAYAPALQLNLSPVELIILHAAAPFIPALPKPRIAGDTTWQGYTANPLKAILQLRKLQSVVRRELRNVCQPVLVLQGRRDQTIDQHSAELVYQGVGSAVKELHWLEHSGHCLLLDEELDLATRLTLDFIARAGKPAAS